MGASSFPLNKSSVALIDPAKDLRSKSSFNSSGNSLFTVDALKLEVINLSNSSCEHCFIENGDCKKRRIS